MSLAAAPSSESEDPDSPAGPDRSARRDPLWTPAFTRLVIAQALFGFAYSVSRCCQSCWLVAYGATAQEIGIVMAAFGVLSLALDPAVSPMVARSGAEEPCKPASRRSPAPRWPSCSFVARSSLPARFAGCRGGPAPVFCGRYVASRRAGPRGVSDTPSAHAGASLARLPSRRLAGRSPPGLGPGRVFAPPRSSAAAGGWFGRRIPVGEGGAIIPYPTADRSAFSGRRRALSSRSRREGWPPPGCSPSWHRPP